MLLISDNEYISYLVQMMEELALEKEEEEAKDDFSETNDVCDQLLESANRDNSGTEIEGCRTF